MTWFRVATSERSAAVRLLSSLPGHCVGWWPADTRQRVRTQIRRALQTSQNRSFNGQKECPALPSWKGSVGGPMSDCLTWSATVSGWTYLRQGSSEQCGQMSGTCAPIKKRQSQRNWGSATDLPSVNRLCENRCRRTPLLHLAPNANAGRPASRDPEKPRFGEKQQRGPTGRGGPRQMDGKEVSHRTPSSLGSSVSISLVLSILMWVSQKTETCLTQTWTTNLARPSCAWRPAEPHPGGYTGVRLGESLAEYERDHTREPFLRAGRASTKQAT